MVDVLSAGGLDISGQLLNQTVQPCKVSLCAGAYCDCAILHSMRNFEQNVAGFRKAVAHSFDKVSFFQFCKGACHAGNAAPQIFCKTGKRIEYINATLRIDPVVLLRKSCSVQQQGVEQLCCVAQVCIQQKAGIG